MSLDGAQYPFSTNCPITKVADMVLEAGDVQRFLSQHPPFSNLTEDQLEYASSNTTVAFGKSGTVPTIEPDSGMLVVRSGSLEVRDAVGALVDRLSSGDYVPVNTRDDSNAQAQRIHVLEDCLYYEIAANVVHALGLGRAESAAASVPADHDSGAGNTSGSTQGTHWPLQSFLRAGKSTYLNQCVEDAMSGDMVCADRDHSIRDAARLMKQRRVSSLMIIEHEKLTGILTDRDLRVRVLADGVAADAAIGEVMTPSPLSIEIGSLLHDAQLTMMSRGIHHLPVVKEGRPVGIVTLSDILRANNAEPLSLIQLINRADTIDELSRAASGLPALIVKLSERDTRAVEVGKIVTAVTDSLTRRLMALSERRYGAPPCAYAWLGFGSQARQEQMIGSDQDNGLLLANGVSADDMAYFADFTEFVNTGLDRCGIPYCPGGIMAKNAQWRMTLTHWQSCFADWIQGPSPKAIMHASIFFDMRHIAGEAALSEALQSYVLAMARENTIFQAFMCDNALQHSPPLGFFKSFVLETDGDHNHTLDLKKRGTIPIVDIARNYALSVGLAQLNTLERLNALVDTGMMSTELASSLVDAHEFIARLRLEDHGKKYLAEQVVDNHLDPSRLSPLVRHQLKDAFSVVRDAQSAMKARFGGGVL